MSIKGTECTEPSLNFLALCMFNSVHASQKADVRDILDCDYKVFVQIVNMLLDQISSKKRQLNK